MHIDPETGSILLPHTSHPIRVGMTAQEMYKLGILKGNYHLRGSESAGRVVVNDQPAGLTLNFNQGVFYEARLNLVNFRHGTNELRDCIRQTSDAINLNRTSKSFSATQGYGHPSEGEAWISIVYFDEAGKDFKG